MNKTRWNRVEKIVDQALKLPDQKRSSFIQQACRGDEGLIHSVNELLRSIEESEGYLENPAEQQDELLKDFANELEDVSSQSSMIGERIGAYQVTELLGHGGMGSVFLAERADGTFEHKVALKLVRRGMDTPENIARFQRERTILANLNHPNIANMHDGGLTSDGLPYLIMEYVDGVPVDRYCQEHDLTIEECLDLFRTVCRAVRYAHNNLVIHRDLKPGNIFVDQQGQIKILDFGIAKLLEVEQTGQPIFETRPGAQMMTLAYAAPEQLTGTIATTATDNYALGLLLHQLLTGRHPFDLEDKSNAEIKELIQHQIPPKASTHAPHRAGALKGDLDAIIRKALRKNPELRYNSAGELLEDIKRYTQSLPVSARDDTFRYNISKFVNRHKSTLASALVLLLIFTGFGLFYTYQITLERNQARIEAQKAQQVSDFVLQLFEASDPEQSQGTNLPVDAILQQGEKQVGQLKGQPEVKMTMYSVLGEVYRKLGEPQTGLPLMEKATSLADSLFSGPNPQKAEIYSMLGQFKRELGDYARAESLFAEAEQIYNRSLQQPSDAQVANLTNMAELYTDQGTFKKAERNQQRALQILKQLPEPQKEMEAYALNQMSIIYSRLGNTEMTETYSKRTLTRRQELYSSPHPEIATSLHNLGVFYFNEGVYDSSRIYFQDALAQRKALYHDNHPLLASTLNGMGLLNNVVGNHNEAELQFRKALRILKQQYGNEHLRVALNMLNLAGALEHKSKFTEAIAYLDSARAMTKKLLGEENFYTAVVEGNLGEAYTKAGDYALGRQAYHRALALFKATSPNHYRIGGVHTGLGRIYLHQAVYDSAEIHLREALNIYTAKFDSSSQRLATARILLGEALFNQQRYSEAENLLVRGRSALSANAQSQQLNATSDSLLQQISSRF